MGSRRAHEQSRWVLVESMDGGWLVRCRLCGKRFTRTFPAAATDYAQAERGSREYLAEHLASAAHRAALETFHGAEIPPMDPHDVKLFEIFGRPLPDERERRREAARGAAERAARDERR